MPHPGEETTYALDCPSLAIAIFGCLVEHDEDVQPQQDGRSSRNCQSLLDSPKMAILIPTYEEYHRAVLFRHVFVLFVTFVAVVTFVVCDKCNVAFVACNKCNVTFVACMRACNKNL
jgi:hypothetical protein